MPDIHFLNSPKSEEERIKFTRKVIAEGFYQRHGFVVMGELDKGVDPNTIVVYPKDFEYQPSETNKYQRDWDQINEGFWAGIESYFPGITLQHGAIEVRITRYGTVSSGAMLGKHKSGKVVYYLRQDMGVEHLAAMIINAILYGERKGLGITWSKREALMDFVMTRPAMKKLFPHFRSVMSQLARVPAKIRRQSEAYLRELGLPRPKEEFEVGKLHLSKLEKKVMKLLVDHQGELVSYDELADTVWGVGEFKTFWALNKLVERMRGKLDKQGIEDKRVESVRGQGYLLR